MSEITNINKHQKALIIYNVLINFYFICCPTVWLRSVATELRFKIGTTLYWLCFLAVVMCRYFFEL
jgi:hypothetical protein